MQDWSFKTARHTPINQWPVRECDHMLMDGALNQDGAGNNLSIKEPTGVLVMLCIAQEQNGNGGIR